MFLYRKFDKILLILDVKFKTIMINMKCFCIFRKIKSNNENFIKILENIRKFKQNSRRFDRNSLKCQYLSMNWDLYLYYLCSNYLTTAPNHRPNWGKAQHLYGEGARPPVPPRWLRPCRTEPPFTGGPDPLGPLAGYSPDKI